MNHHKKLVGRIIFSNLLSCPLEKYLNLIEETDVSLRLKGISLRTQPLSPCVSDETGDTARQVAARLLNRGQSVEVAYADDRLNRKYLLSSEEQDFWVRSFQGSPSEKEALSLLFHKIRRINSRNTLTHLLLTAVIARQTAYLRSGARALGRI